MNRGTFLKPLFILILYFLFLSSYSTLYASTFKLSKNTMYDKIKGGWAGQVIGCTFGGPTEFKFNGTFIQDYQPIPWYDGYIKKTYDKSPGLYDDVYMDLTFVQVFEKEGLNAPVESFAKAFAYANYSLWHANQAARYNIINGKMPPESGHWLNNPHADDIDFQIEADFAGLMSPGMVNTSSEICDKIGHIMNYGDGWYGGVYVAAMYSLAFISDDIFFVVEQALRVIPSESQYAKCMNDVIRWYKENPHDWKQTWFNVQKKWSEDIGCPDGVFSSFNIDAKINSAWILIGLLYGQKDFGKTISISARCGDDSDCNPASVGGILGTLLGYENIPEYWKMGIKEVELIPFKYTTMSLNDTYGMSVNHAQQLIIAGGGEIKGNQIFIKIQEPKSVPLEIGFEGHYPQKREIVNKVLLEEINWNFTGIGFVMNGSVEKFTDQDYTFQVEMIIDDNYSQTTNLPTNFIQRKNTLFWKYQLPEGEHNIKFKILNPTDNARINLHSAIIYGDKPVKPVH